MIRQCWFVLACVFALATSARAQTTALFIDDEGTYIGAHQQLYFTPATATFNASHQTLTDAFGVHDRIIVDVTPANGSLDAWHLAFSVIDAFQGGVYQAARRDPFATFTGIDVSSDGRGCNQETGTLLVREYATAGNGSLVRLAIDFEQHCEGMAPALFGALRYNSTDADLRPFHGAYQQYLMEVSPPQHGTISGNGLFCGTLTGAVACARQFDGPTVFTMTATPDPGYVLTGWTGACHGSGTIAVSVFGALACSAQFEPMFPGAPRTTFLWHGPAGNWVGHGEDAALTDTNSAWQFTRNSFGNDLDVRIESLGDLDTSDLTIYFGNIPPSGLPPGSYDVTGTLGSGSYWMYLTQQGRGCTATPGRFTIHEFDALPDGTPTRLAMDFEAHCAAGDAPIAASLRYHSTFPLHRAIDIEVSGQGSVFGSDGVQSASCNSNCAQQYPVDNTVTLTPMPAPGWRFAGWTAADACSSLVLPSGFPTHCVATFASLTFGKLAPVNGAFGVAASTVLSWSAYPGAIRYEYCINSFSYPGCTSGWIPVADTQIAVPTPYAIYPAIYWQVRAVTAGGTTDADDGAFWLLQNPVPGSFSALRPSFNERGRSPMTLSWTPSTNANYYEVCVQAASSFDCPGWILTAATSITLPLAPGDYRWDVRARNPLGVTSVQFSNSFTIAAPNTAALGPPQSDVRLLFRYDADPFLDLLVYNRVTGLWAIQRGDAHNRFIDGPSGGWSGGWDLAIADFDNDGRDDVFLYSRVSGTFYKAINRPSGFQYFTQGWQPGFDTYIVDFNGDHRADVFVYNPLTGLWYTCISTGDGTAGFTYTTGGWAAGWQIFPADFNGDGRTDFLLYNRSAGTYFKVISNGSGGFSYTTTGTWAPGWSPTIVDLNGDGRSDVFLYNIAGGAWYRAVSTGDGTGGFALTVGQWAPGWRVQAADFDGDHRSDLFIYNPDTGLFYKVINTGVAFNYFADVWAVWTTAVADLNSDGKSDLFLIDPASGLSYQAITTSPGGFNYVVGSLR